MVLVFEFVLHFALCALILFSYELLTFTFYIFIFNFDFNYV